MAGGVSITLRVVFVLYVKRSCRDYRMYVVKIRMAQ